MQERIDTILEAFDGALELIEDEVQRDRFSRVLAASRASVERAVNDLLVEVASDVNEALGDETSVDLSYGSEGISVDVGKTPPAAGEDYESFSFGDGEAERLTLRLPSELKDRATGAAAQGGFSLNAWIVRVLARELAGDEEGHSRHSGRRGRRGGRRGRRDREGDGPGERLRGWIGG